MNGDGYKKMRNTIFGLIGGVVGLSLALFYVSMILIDVSSKEPAHVHEEEYQSIIHIDNSAKTGFLNSESIMAVFNGYEFPIAMSPSDIEENGQQYKIVYDIRVYSYPVTDIFVPYRVDSFDEAVEFLEGLRNGY